MTGIAINTEKTKEELEKILFGLEKKIATNGTNYAVIKAGELRGISIIEFKEGNGRVPSNEYCVVIDKGTIFVEWGLVDIIVSALIREKIEIKTRINIEFPKYQQLYRKTVVK